MHVGPTALLGALSPEAFAFYRAATEATEKPDLTDAATWAMAQELERAGLGLASDSEDKKFRRFRPTLMHPAFAEAIDGPSEEWDWWAEVMVLPWEGGLHYEGLLLLRAGGCTIDRIDHSQSRQLPVWQLRSRHATATDSDHSRCVLASLSIANPVLSRFSPAGSLEMMGTLSDARLYRHGKGPFTDEDDRGTCADSQCERPHPFGRFVPPKRKETEALAGSLVSVQLLPGRLAALDAAGD